MELDNQTSKQTYMQFLVDALRKKLEVLQTLVKLTEEQEAFMKEEAFDEDLFMQSIDLKDEQLKLLEQLDAGFDRVFEHVKQELLGNKYKYEAEIKALQDYIGEITDRSVTLQAMELRNKTKLEAVLLHKRKEIKKSKVSSRTASAYYKTMTNQGETASYFYDKKK